MVDLRPLLQKKLCLTNDDEEMEEGKPAPEDYKLKTTAQELRELKKAQAQELKELKCYAAITNMVDSRILTEFSYISTAGTLWAALERRFRTFQVGEKIEKLVKLKALSPSGQGELSKYLDAALKGFQDKGPLDEETKAFILAKGLDGKYESLGMSLIGRQFDYIITAIKAYADGDEVKAATSSRMSSRMGPCFCGQMHMYRDCPNKATHPCYRCRKHGHKAAFCPENKLILTIRAGYLTVELVGT
jgi:hypothetical protein